MKKTVAIVTTSRADFGIYRPIIKEIEKSNKIDYFLIVTGTHLSKTHGYTVDEIVKENFKIGETGEIILTSDSYRATAKSMALALLFFADVYERRRPDMVLVLGDRFEMHSAALAALPFKIKVAHIHGGEVTKGAMDDSLRHSITKLSYLHFVSTREYKRRVIQLGEEPRRVFVTGAPSLDNLKSIKLLTKNEVEKVLNIKIEKPIFLLTLHPETATDVSNKKSAYLVVEALKHFKGTIIATMPNADPGGIEIREVFEKESKINKNFHCVENLGNKLYFSLMKIADAMVGNSSSGILESPSFKLPVVNIGDRQKGRLRNKNVIDCPFSKRKIVEAIKKATSEKFKNEIRKVKNIYGNGDASHKIVKVIEKVIDINYQPKRFYDLKFKENLDE
jgi:UDP-hydrolysing UDP-N-acetyl-D-glucosamine 2-epimerase